MNYSNVTNSVRVDFFRPAGKWVTTEAVIFVRPFKGLIRDAFEESLISHIDGSRRLTGLWAVCLDPCHEHAHPLMIRVPEPRDESE